LGHAPWRIANFKYPSNYTAFILPGVQWVLVALNVHQDDLRALSYSANIESSLKDASIKQKSVFQTRFPNTTSLRFWLAQTSCIQNTSENAAEYR
jgi:hypothetical protein